MKRPILRNQKLRFDKKLLLVTFILVFVGIIAVADASAPQALNIFGDKFHFLKDQLFWVLIGSISLLISYKINYKFWEKVATPFFFFCVLLLILVLIPGIGAKYLGARRWFSIGPVLFQPSELTKFGLILYLSKLMSKKSASILYFLPLVIVGALVILEPDLGTTLILVLSGMIQIFSSEINLFQFAGVAILGVVSVLGLVFISPYRKERLMTYFQQTSDPLGSSYHIRQVLLALGSGGFFGVGIGQSRQKYLFLPEASTDSIFAVIAEELGFIGGFVLIGLLFFYVLRGLTIAKHAPDKFSEFLALGISSWIGVQVILNIASMTALLPLTGIPLPFISYGGSSLIMIMFATGILLNISKYTVKDAKR